MADEGVSILETETYTLALMFLIFLALFVTVERVRHAVFGCFLLVARKLGPTTETPAAAEMATSCFDTPTQSWPAGMYTNNFQVQCNLNWHASLSSCELLQAALDAVKLELMLFGVASLLLKVLETPITSICSELLPMPSPSLPHLPFVACLP